MRHLKSGRALGVKPAHRRAMLRNLVTSLLEHEQITTTVARAKEMRTPLDKMITFGKKGDLASRRRALSFVKSKKAMTALFDELPERYAERPGGYCRIVRVGRRRGDGAEMALIQLVDAPNDVLANAEKPTSRRGQGRGRRAQAGGTEKGKGKAAAKKDEAQVAASEEATVVEESVEEAVIGEAAAPEAVAPEEAPKVEEAAAPEEAPAETGEKDKAAKPKKPRKAAAKKAEAPAAEEGTADEPEKNAADADDKDKEA